MKNEQTITITLKNGNTCTWGSCEWDDYAYDGKMFIIKLNEAWVGFYNIDSLICITIK